MRAWPAFVLGFILVGCAREARHEPDSKADRPPAPLVAVRLVYGDRAEPIFCEKPWTAWIEWLGGVRRFRLYDREQGRVTSTDDFGVFLAALDALPANIEIDRLDTCGCPRAYDMPDDARKRIHEVMERGRRRWAWNEIQEWRLTQVCICEVERLEFPDP